MVNSQVQVRQVMDLMEDVKFGEVLNKVGADYNGFNTFMKGLKKHKSLHKMHTQLKMIFGKYLHTLVNNQDLKMLTKQKVYN